MLTAISRCAPAAALATAALSASAAEIVVGGTTGAAIQAAIDAAGPGDTVRLAANTTYVLTAPLDFFKSNEVNGTDVTLAGAGRGSTVLAFRGSGASAAALIDLEDASRVGLTGFTLDGENRIDGAAVGVIAGYGTGHRLDGLGVRNLAGPSAFAPIGVYFFESVHDSLVTGSTFENIGVASAFGSGVRVHGDSDDNLIEGNTFKNLGRGGVFGKGEGLGGPDRLVIRGNTVENSGLGGGDALGIEIQTDVNDAVIEGNTVDRWLSVDGSDRVAVRGNVVTGNPGERGATGPYGIELVNTQQVVVTGNTVTGGTDFGLSIAGEGDTRHAFIADNNFHGAGAFGVQIQGDDSGDMDGVAERLYLANNVFTGSGSDAVRINRNVHGVVIHGGVLDADHGFSVGLAELPITGIVVTGDAAQRPDGVESGYDTDVTASRTVPEFTFNPGDAITLVFGDAAIAAGLPALEDLDLVLWDLGNGTPSLTDVFGDNGSSATLDAGRAGDLRPGQVVRAVAWDTDGDSNYVTVRVVPEPAAAGLLALGGLSLLRRRR